MKTKLTDNECENTVGGYRTIEQMDLDNLSYYNNQLLFILTNVNLTWEEKKKRGDEISARIQQIIEMGNLDPKYTNYTKERHSDFFD